MEKKITSADLRIDLISGKSKEYSKWFLACLLFGHPIQQEVAKRTYLEFEKSKIISPGDVVNAGWNRLVKVLDKGHYVRYDYSTATKLINISKQLLHDYGSVKRMITFSKNRNDLKARLLKFNGIGPKTGSIFIKELEKYKIV